MLEATLFGYEKGAFTGAIKSMAGKFEQAQGGTLLLDEITEMPIELQSKLLRVLQERQVERLGRPRPLIWMFGYWRPRTVIPWVRLANSACAKTCITD